ncbi:class I SAM-dependent rRNA methyltransferase [Aureliella helgolandensis]|uniref:Ribosomal RNA large subunit methyltransferase I n=1 Tax=Aureliella helgolandensis TaxID=2527968 RepID=A0A518GGY8_9BACT|nr:class I SAM-dependent rRNA methyltransferase [Aureliella helgolandensis]QDV27840.1 Ribosomal RNA large subunit methyltransferase I [Aureliella helgolandensis]
MQALPQLILNSRNAGNFTGHHPWVLNRSIIEPTSAVAAGQAVELVTSSGQWIGRGIYNPASRIRVRLYQWDANLNLDSAWVLGQVERAVNLRQHWLQSHQALTAVRLVNSEGDGLSGLIVDQFGDYIVVQVTALAMLGWLDEIVAWLQERFHPQGIFLRTDAKTASNEGMEPRDELLRGAAPESLVELVENDVRVGIDLTSGQKTGYYLDQRANRLRAARWVQAGEMLDVCCYLGGFSLAACRWGQPTKVTAVDSSAKALEQAQQNAHLNGFAQIEFQKADCFDYLEQTVATGKKFQTIVLDPPRMAGNRNQVPAALRAYHRLNLSAVNLLQPGGILITCSCSGRVGREDFVGMLGSVAKRSRRRIQILENTGADVDHPVDVNCPETEYLKCLICQVI